MHICMGTRLGGTNPSLLEALGSTDLNLLLDVGFNREVAEDAALYWTKEPGNLAKLIAFADALPQKKIGGYGLAASEVISKRYTWNYISNSYLKQFL